MIIKANIIEHRAHSSGRSAHEIGEDALDDDHEYRTLSRTSPEMVLRRHAGGEASIERAPWPQRYMGGVRFSKSGHVQFEHSDRRHRYRRDERFKDLPMNLRHSLLEQEFRLPGSPDTMGSVLTMPQIWKARLPAPDPRSIRYWDFRPSDEVLRDTFRLVRQITREEMISVFMLPFTIGETLRDRYRAGRALRDTIVLWANVVEEVAWLRHAESMGGLERRVDWTLQQNKRWLVITLDNWGI